MAAPDVYRIADNQIMDEIQLAKYIACLLYTSDAADD